MSGRRDRLRKVVGISRAEVASGLELSHFVGEDGGGEGAAYFERLEQETIRKFNQLAKHLQQKEEAAANGSAEAEELAADEAPTTGYVSTETQFSFTVPPHFSPLFYVRYRTVIDGSTAEPWINPLDYRAGTLFTPKLRIKTQAKQGGLTGSKKSEKAFVYRIPPPVVLSNSWEKSNIIQDKLYQEEGTLRVYTISGLTPSLEKGDSWTNWMFSSAGQGLYGRRKLEVQFAECDSLSQTFEEIPESKWRMLPTVSYDIPSVDLITGLLFMTLNWARSVGIKQLEDALLGQFDSNRVVWQNILKDFAGEMTIKLEPVWQKSVYPWLAKDQTLQFLLKDKRDSIFRHNALKAMEFLQSFKVIKTVPDKFRRICPRIDKLAVSALSSTAESPGDGITFIPGNDSGSTIRSVVYEVVEGTSFVITGTARKSAFYEAVEEVPQDYYLKLWWCCDNVSSGHYIDLSSGLIASPGDYVAGHGGKIRKKSLNQPKQDSMFQDLLTINASGKHGNLLLEEGTTLSFRLIAEEYGAHEDDVMELRIKVVPPSARVLKRRLSVDSELKLDTIVDPSQDVIENPVRRAVPQLVAGSPTDEQVLQVFEKLLKSEETIGLTDEETVGYMLHELGHSPTQLDMQLAVEAIVAEIGISKSDEEYKDEDLNGRSTLLKESDAFLAWYRRSSFSESMLQSTMTQVEDTLRERRNDILKKYLKIPQEEWGFKPNEWGGVLPESKLLVKHATGLAKVAMHKSWLRQQEVQIEEPATAADVETPERRKLVDLLRAEDVENSDLGAVVEVYIRNMAKARIANSLPKKMFSAEERKRWVMKHVEADSSFDVVFHEFMVWKIAEYYQELKKETELSAEAKQARKVEAAERQKTVIAFLEGGVDAAALYDDIGLSDLCKEVAKTITREQVKVVAAELVPLIKDEILPSLVQGLMEFAQETIRRNKLLLLGSSMLVLVVVAPRSFRTLFTDVSASALSKLQN